MMTIAPTSNDNNTPILSAGLEKAVEESKQIIERQLAKMKDVKW